MASVFDVARYILSKLGADGKLPITTWKLQKLVYYTQAWSVVWSDAPLFDAEIEAWANGPVCPDLYKVHKGSFQIKELPKDCGNEATLTDDQKDSINVVLSHYGSKSAQYLSELTHRERPWIEARNGLKAGERGDNEISLESMAEYYGSL